MKVFTDNEFVKKNKEMLIIFGVLAFFTLLIGIGWQLRQGETKQTPPPPVEPKEIKVTVKDSAGDNNSSQKTAKVFALQPGPKEILEQIKAVVDAELPVAPEDLETLQVMWPVYFFKIIEVRENLAVVLFDVDEHGFGLVIQTEIDASIFPEILHKKKGEKIWIAGGIAGIDPNGTGAIQLQTEYCHCSSEPPVSQQDKQQEKRSEKNK